jgi:hypothetical protein
LRTSVSESHARDRPSRRLAAFEKRDPDEVYRLAVDRLGPALLENLAAAFRTGLAYRLDAKPNSFGLFAR